MQLIEDVSHMQVRACTTGGTAIQGLVKLPVASAADLLSAISAASHLRSVAATAANAVSSRSHLIIRLNAVVARGGGEHVISELNLVDLAGSERMNRAQTGGDAARLREGNTINRDLLCLGNVITALVARSRAAAPSGQHAGGPTHVPYRACKLTRILQTALGGAAKTVLIACVSKLPEWHLEQTKSTLEFAARAAQVVCVPKIAARLAMLRKPGLANAQLEEAAAEVQRPSSLRCAPRAV
jgi:hypothetical protein